MKAVSDLSAWYERSHRRLPWRETRDPYSIWISEVMLQQTQVATVIPYYAKFLDRFPTVADLAGGDIHDVLALWSGLGYYSRARNLHRGAKYLVEHHDGKFPLTREAILKVPGIGPYTAGAILSIAFNLPEALVDGNVQRVFARFLGEEREIEKREVQDRFWEEARKWVKRAEEPRVLNQALMELGATICTKGTPSCPRCPISKNCVSFGGGYETELPRRKQRRRAVELWWASHVFVSKGKIFVHQNPDGEWWADLWDFPHEPLKTEKDFARYAGKLADKYGRAERIRTLDRQRHTVTHHKLCVTPYEVELPSPALLGEASGRWLLPDEARRLPLSSLARKILESRHD